MSRVTVRGSIDGSSKEIIEAIRIQLPERAYRGANELRNSALDILTGQRSGRMYGGHRASAPGEPPATWSGVFKNAWHPRSLGGGSTFISRIENGVFYAGWLENGTPGGQMAPRPHHKAIQEHATPRIMRIYQEPYV